MDDNGKLVSLLLNDSNDFVLVELQSNSVRDVFCLLMKRIREERINHIAMSMSMSTSNDEKNNI